MTECSAWFDSRPTTAVMPPPSGAGTEEPRPPWSLRPEGRTHWMLVREDQGVAELGMLGTGEWWICPVGEGLPWAETYGSRGAAIRAVVVWWLHTHPFDTE